MMFQGGDQLLTALGRECGRGKLLILEEIFMGVGNIGRKVLCWWCDKHVKQPPNRTECACMIEREDNLYLLMGYHAVFLPVFSAQAGMQTV